MTQALFKAARSGWRLIGAATSRSSCGDGLSACRALFSGLRAFQIGSNASAHFFDLEARISLKCCA